MFKFTVLCLMVVMSSAIAHPGVVSPLAYSAVPAASYAPFATQIGYTAPIVAPYASSYNAHNIDHSVAYPYAVAPATYATTAAYGAQVTYAAPAAYTSYASPAAAYAAPAAYASPSAYAAPAAYAAAAYAPALLK